MFRKANRRDAYGKRMDNPELKEGENMIEDIISKKNTPMSDAARKAANAYKRAWNARNPEKNKEYQRRYWAKKAKEIELSRQESAGKDVLTNGVDGKAD